MAPDDPVLARTARSVLVAAHDAERWLDATMALLEAVIAALYDGRTRR